ncbi:MAG: sugar phosphorylase [Candidatus Thermofonsia Clade 1 bacterium]|uniref:Sugar phosphorylase n=1 Tax=Candidatus Thermofonsia Clade 1 bacterium TaxID=2364210 RepID=A0A2M8PHB3_9CHLR|nr:MAG: sugar phosphorylase [Candidatus Thermofonsia Clade 1 bacterium]
MGERIGLRFPPHKVCWFDVHTRRPLAADWQQAWQRKGKSMTSAAHERLRECLARIYPPELAAGAYEGILSLLAKAEPPPAPKGDYFSEQTVTLITYGDTLNAEGEAPLATLRRFCRAYLADVLDTIHLLPHYPYSSDDGFSVMDYYAVNPALGTWQDVKQLGADFRLMFDAVINHMSAQSQWFKRFLAGDPEFNGLFFTESPEADLSAVVRPRTTPLLTPFVKADGSTVHVWTTFSADQVDLDYRQPSTLLRILDVLLFYVAQGAQVLRLDAIAFMWKQAGTPSIHLPQTHAIIQAIRAVMDIYAPHVVLITETNVPHAENVSYFGDGFNEAQLVYNFTLPPLLFYSMATGRTQKLCDWLNTLQTPSQRTAFFNFTASHDGIGVRPVEGILSADELQLLIDIVERRGGRVSYRAQSDGTRTPYELNCTYVDAIADPGLPLEVQVKRFLLSQGVMLAMAGVPAIYIHSLLGTRNDLEGMARTGQNRSINRAKLPLREIEMALSAPQSFRAQVFEGYKRLLRARRTQRAFHPLGAQRAYTLNGGAVLALERSAPDGEAKILALFNFSDAPQQVTLWQDAKQEVISQRPIADKAITLLAYEMSWLRLHA